MNPGYSDAYHGRGYCYSLLGRKQEADADYAEEKRLREGGSPVIPPDQVAGEPQSQTGGKADAEPTEKTWGPTPPAIKDSDEQSSPEQLEAARKRLLENVTSRMLALATGQIKIPSQQEAGELVADPTSRYAGIDAGLVRGLAWWRRFSAINMIMAVSSAASGQESELSKTIFQAMDRIDDRQAYPDPKYPGPFFFSAYPGFHCILILAALLCGRGPRFFDNGKIRQNIRGIKKGPQGVPGDEPGRPLREQRTQIATTERPHLVILLHISPWDGCFVLNNNHSIPRQ